MTNLWCLSGYGVIHPWYETAAELLYVVRGKSYLWNSRRVGLLAPWLLLVELAEVRWKRCSLAMPLVFVLFFQVAKEKVTSFPKMSFEWAQNVKSLHCSLFQVGGKKSYLSPQGWSTILDKTEGRKTLQPFLWLSCCHLCCSGQVPFPPALPLHSSSDLPQQL